MRVERRECANKFECRSQTDTTVQACGSSHQDFGDKLEWKATHSCDERQIATASHPGLCGSDFSLTLLLRPTAANHLQCQTEV